MRIFAKNSIIAKSKFWKQMKNQNKLKPSQGEILSVNEIFEKDNKVVRTYGMVIKYHSRSGIHNFYKRIQRCVDLRSSLLDVYAYGRKSQSNGGTLSKLFELQWLRSRMILKGPPSWQYRKSKLRFPIVKTLPRATEKKYRSIFKGKQAKSLQIGMKTHYFTKILN